eukprot:COSAG06_NODE_7336_length_2542_cov_1.187884_2_plen_182_part_00
MLLLRRAVPVPPRAAASPGARRIASLPRPPFSQPLVPSLRHLQHQHPRRALADDAAGWRAPEPNPAHDIAHQCPPGASLAKAPVGFDAAAAKAEEVERFATIATMSREEAEAACEELGVVVWKPQSGRPVPLERLQQHLRDHFAGEQAQRGVRQVASNPAAAAASAAEAQAIGQRALAQGK